MNVLPAASLGIFDNPWVVALVLVGGAIANWLGKRREQREAARKPASAPPGAGPAPAPQTDPDELDLETILRRLTGQTQETPAPPTAPPPFLPSASSRTREPVVPTWDEDEGPPPLPMPRPMPPRRPSGLRPAPSATMTATAAASPPRPPTMLPLPAARQPAGAVPTGAGRATRPHPLRARWRTRRGVREAFVASLVFGAPKSLQP